MAGVAQAVARSIGEATAESSRLIESCVDQTVTALQGAESQASGEQRQQMADAWRELIGRRKAWSTRFRQLLALACEAEAGKQPKPKATPGARPQRHGLAPFSLVDDSEIARSIEEARLAQQLASALERPLAELDALMSSALGLPGVQPERNPLRPAVYVQVLLDVIGEDAPEPAITALWLRFMAAPLAQELEQAYRGQADLLKNQNVNAASYRVRSAGPQAHRGRKEAHPRPGSPQPGDLLQGSNGDFEDTPLSGLDAQRLQQLLSGGEPPPRRPLGPGYYRQAKAELHDLETRPHELVRYDAASVRRQSQLQPVDRPPRFVDTQSPLPEQLWGRYSAPRERALVRGRLRTQARDVAQVYSLELVRRLVDRVASDPRLLTPVREAIVGLEPALLRLSMVAPLFFSDENHPGRLLVEAVAQRSFKYNDEFSVDFQGFFGPVAQSFQRLNELDPLQDEAPFRTALAALQAAWRAQDELDEEAQLRALDSVQFAERRQHEADAIAAEFRQRPDLDAVAEPVREFVLGPWALVVAHARLTQPGGIDPGGHLAVVSDLLWSVNPAVTLRDPARAFELIPRLLPKLRKGLATIGQQPAEIDEFFQLLEGLHRPVLQLRATHRQRELPPAPPAVAVPRGASARPPVWPWMGTDERQAAGFESSVFPEDRGVRAPAGSRPAPIAEQPLEEVGAEQVIAELVPGCWVDLYSRQQWRRAQLKWTSDRRTLYMFVSQGGQPHSMTRRSIERLVRDRLLRRVDNEAVVPRALARLGEPPEAAPPA
jgi:hypothetical protein